MDLVEFWIWEHATKHGMAKVLKRMTSSYCHCESPNSWLAAQLLRRIKEEWDLPERITFQEISSVQVCLTSIFDHYRTNLKAAIKTIDFIKLQLVCKATFLVLRSESSELRVWKQARDESFPIWNEQLWTRVKRTYALKNDKSLQEYKNFFEELKAKLQPRNCKQSVLDLFSIQMKKSFPLLVAFLLRIKLSVLERMKIEGDKRRTSSCNLDPDIQFLPALLAKGIHDEIHVLNIWEEVQRRKFKKRSEYDSKIIRAVKPSGSSTVGVFHAVPSKSDTLAEPSLGFPPCFTLNPCIPTSYTRRNRDGELEEIEIDKRIPRDVNGIAVFNPFWFTDGSKTPKQEGTEVELHEAREWNSVETRNHSETPNKKQCRQRLVESELPEREIPSEPRESLSLACRPRHSNKISISIGSPKSAVHHEAEDSLEGRRIVSRLLERLQEQSHLLSKRSNDANKHCKELNHCMNRILRVHKEIGNEEENDMISVEPQR